METAYKANEHISDRRNVSLCFWVYGNFFTFRIMEASLPDGNILVSLVQMKMPFGKYKGVLLANLPVSYLEWFAKKGFPPGKLGMMLATLYEIKINGLEHLLQPLKGKSY